MRKEGQQYGLYEESGGYVSGKWDSEGEYWECAECGRKMREIGEEYKDERVIEYIRTGRTIGVDLAKYNELIMGDMEVDDEFYQLLELNCGKVIRDEAKRIIDGRTGGWENLWNRIINYPTYERMWVSRKVPICSECLVCDKCGLSSEEYLRDGDDLYCTDCAVECYHCDKVLLKDGTTKVDDEYICEDCLNDNYTFCEDCEEWYNNDSDHVLMCADCDGLICSDKVMDKIARYIEKLIKMAGFDIGTMKGNKEEDLGKMEEVEKIFDERYGYGWAQDKEDILDDLLKKDATNVVIRRDGGEILGYVYGYRCSIGDIEDAEEELEIELVELKKMARKGKLFYVANLVVEPIGRSKVLELLLRFREEVRNKGYEYVIFEAMSDSARLLFNPDGSIKERRLKLFNASLEASMVEDERRLVFLRLN